MTGRFHKKMMAEPLNTLTERQSYTIKAVLEEAYIDLPPEGSEAEDFEKWVARWFGDI